MKTNPLILLLFSFTLLSGYGMAQQSGLTSTAGLSGFVLSGEAGMSYRTSPITTIACNSTGTYSDAQRPGYLFKVQADYFFKRKNEAENNIQFGIGTQCDIYFNKNANAINKILVAQGVYADYSDDISIKSAALLLGIRAIGGRSIFTMHAGPSYVYFTDIVNGYTTDQPYTAAHLYGQGPGFLANAAYEFCLSDSVSFGLKYNACFASLRTFNTNMSGNDNYVYSQSLDRSDLTFILSYHIK